jgi:hypothetical protein
MHVDSSVRRLSVAKIDMAYRNFTNGDYHFNTSLFAVWQIIRLFDDDEMSGRLPQNSDNKRIQAPMLEL